MKKAERGQTLQKQKLAVNRREKDTRYNKWLFEQQQQPKQMQQDKIKGF